MLFWLIAIPQIALVDNKFPYQLRFVVTEMCRLAGNTIVYSQMQIKG
jgi:hypothetical protein